MTILRARRRSIGVLSWLVVGLLSTAITPASADPYDQEYHRYSGIVERLGRLATDHPGIAQQRVIGRTFEGRDIPALTIGDTGGDKPRLLITCGQQAREWISVAVCMGAAGRLVAGYNSDPDIKNQVDKHPIDIIPLVNPDGYEYAHTTNRIWVKNRSPQSDGKCAGANLDRNYDHDFGRIGTNTKPCSDNYGGGEAFSELETKAVRDFVNARKVAAAIDFQAYGQLVLYPWGSKAEYTPDHARLSRVGEAIADSMRPHHGTRYRVGTPPDLLYPASGKLMDWLYATQRTLAFAIELPDDGRYGFLLPTSHIEPAIDEALAGIRSLLGQM